MYIMCLNMYSSIIIHALYLTVFNIQVPLCEHVFAISIVPRLHFWWAEGGGV